jgi:hypothetical protein
MRVETIPGAPAARFTDEGRDSIDVIWNGFRPLASLQGLSGEERAAVHRLNVERRKIDLADYERFLAEFGEEARGCRTLEELVAHGRPRVPEPPAERGAMQGERADLDAIHGGFIHATLEGLWDITRIRAKLDAHRLPLDVRIEASVGLKARVGGRVVGAETSLTDLSGTGSYGAAGVTEKCKLDELGETSCATAIGGATVSSRGLESLEIATGATYARATRETVAAGVRLGRTIGGEELALRAEAKLGLNVQLLDAETVRRALSNEDFWTKKR